MTDRAPATIRHDDWRSVLTSIGIDPADLAELHATEHGVELVHVRRGLDGNGVIVGDRFALVTTTVGWER